MASWLDDLNDAQREAATFGDGPLLIIAGAGTGKTKTLACRVAHLIEQGVRPERILLLTFTRRAAAEMIGRAEKLCGTAETGKVWGGTFHAAANRLLRIYGDALSIPKTFTVMDQGDAADLMNLIRTQRGAARKNRRFPKKMTLVAIYSHTVNAQKPLEKVLAEYFPWCGEDIEEIKPIFREYTRRKATHHLMDYDDLLLYWNALCQVGRVGETVADRFEHILVDEYQDTNTVQADILRGMRKKYENITVVGDDAQSIYSFRSATIRNILDFPKAFPGVKTVTLERNYRSTMPILGAANAVMGQALERYTKSLWSDREEGARPVLYHCQDEAEQTSVLCSRILEDFEREIPLQQQAVLFRAGHHSADLEIELTRRNIPYHKFGGLKFIEAAHIKDTLAVLRIIENPYDAISWFRVLQLLEGIGPKTAQRIMEGLGVTGDAGASEAEATDEVFFSLPLRTLMLSPPRVPRAAGGGIGELQQTVADCAGVKLPKKKMTSAGGSKAGALERCDEPPIAVQLERVSTFLKPIIERVYDNYIVRLRDVEQLVQIAARFRSRGRFITDLTLDPPSATSDLAQPPHLDDDFLNLSTIHSAKGCEWSVVHILHVADGMIPSDMAVGDSAGVDEERRLLYVAMTRAKNQLYLYFPQRYYHARYRTGDRHGFAQISRFLTKNVRRTLEERIGGVAGEDDLRRHISVHDAESVRKGIDELWGD